MTQYTIEILAAETDARDYLSRFRDVPRFEELCKACPVYGTTWACPPLPPEVETVLTRSSRVLLRAVRVKPSVPHQPASEAEAYFAAARIRLQKELLALEQTTGGRAFTGIGGCRICEEGCTRPEGEPCRHPELLRPSLEALGFDIERTLGELLGVRLLWPAEDTLPEYLVAVGAVFI